MNVFYCRSSNSRIIDVVGADGLGGYSRLNIEQLAAKYGGQVEMMDSEEAVKLVEEAHKTEPVEIDEERFIDALEVLPPCKWGRSQGQEAFHVSERLCHTIVEWCVRIGTQYFSFNDTCRLTTQEAITKVKNHLLKIPTPA